tara:strand:- start:491 stop:802 length:312 start_codon:yes stop_codon:yes gene_type:complete
MYKPLPESVTIKQSGINGLGLFAEQQIMQGTNLGISHIKIDDTLIRTPLGGFVNHANDPNCAKVELRANGYQGETFKKKWNLVTLKDIKKGEELTLRYTFYTI